MSVVERQRAFGTMPTTGPVESICFDAAVRADDHRRAVAGVDERDAAVVVEPADDGGGETVRRQQRLQKLVEPLHGRGGIAAGASRTR